MVAPPATASMVLGVVVGVASVRRAGTVVQQGPLAPALLSSVVGPIPPGLEALKRLAERMRWAVGTVRQACGTVPAGARWE